jgi:hypothetical protein
LRFDPSEIRARYAACKSSSEIYNWSFDPDVLRRFEEDVWSIAVKPMVVVKRAAGETCGTVQVICAANELGNFALDLLDYVRLLSRRE